MSRTLLYSLMKQLAILFILFCFAQHSMGQTYTVKGSVKDTLNGVPLPLSSAVLISAKDSTIAAFARADSNGNFILTADKEGKYILRITFPSFADYVDPVTINKSVTNVGMVAMVSKEHLLKEFVLTQQISAIKIKGDTTEYMADSFKVKAGANVEDMLKRLPGIEVDKDGKITAQGETVQKILVDGEEFFSDDPKVVTKGLQANVVERVQVYDKKSDQAEFTGVDDGQKTKTINLKLKEDRKKGFFGKLDAAGGTDKYYQEQGMINAFKGKRQLAAFGILSNTDKIGLGWQDNGKFGGGNEMISDEDGNTYFTSNNDDGFNSWDGRYNGQGLPKVGTGGVHFADKWNEDKDHITANYRYGMQQVNIDGNTTTQYALPGDTSNVSMVHKTQSSRGERHGLDAMYELKIDSNNSIKLTASAGTKTSEVKSSFTTHNFLRTTEVDDSLYTNQRDAYNKTTANFVNAELLYKKKFAKKGRTLSIDLKENYNQSLSDGHLTSTTVHNIPNPADSVIDQRKTNNANTITLFGKVTYTEPLSKVLNMEVHYSAVTNNARAENFSFNGNGSGVYDTKDYNYSSDYQYNVFTNVGGLYFRWVYKKLNFSLGSNVSNTSYKQTDKLLADTTFNRNYPNVAPKANFNYKISNQRAFNFNYSGKTQQPTLNEIQPLRQNTDPTNITIGNPNLKQEFIHSLFASFNDYKVLTHRSFYMNVNATFVNNDISSSIVNKDGINTTQYVNVNGDYTLNSWISYGFKLKKPDLGLGVNFSPAFNHSNNFINGQKNSNDNNSYEISVHANKYKEDKYQFWFAPGITYYDNKATISTYSTNYWLSNSEFSGSVQITKRLEIGTEVNVMFRQRTVLFPTNNNVVKWNAWIGQKFLKKKELEARLSVFDILNQNIGYDRTATASIITQNNYNTIRRYGMINIIWNFTYQPGGAATTEEGDE